MSERYLFDIIDDLRSDIASLKEFFRKARLENLKTSELVDRLERRLNEIELDLDLQVRLCKYLPSIKRKKAAYRELYSRILFNLRQHRQFIYLLHIVYELISLREKIRKNITSQRFLDLVDKYIDLLAEALNMPTDLLLIVAPQSEYASLPILSEKVFIVMLPLTNLAKPWKWVLLSHELGHLYFQYSEKKILTRILPVIEEELRDAIRDEKQVKRYISLWGEYWLQEIVSDIVAASLSGPAYLKMLIMEATEPIPVQVYDTHPPLDARALAQMTYMKFAGAPDELMSIMERVWRKFRSGVFERASLPDYLNEEIVRRVSCLMVNFIRKPFIATNWDNFRKVMKSLPKVGGEDLSLIVPAMALSDIHAGL
ncbi:MAG: hypothetical protein DRN59_03455 [Thaumarchaeota archaeon]|nr:MAG: hypothetical protein DRN59_03455 [Nitrososphaerota archaeon]